MKGLIGMFFSMSLFCFLSSCSVSEELKTTPTVIKGNVSDVERGLNIENFKIVFIRSWSGSTNWDLYGIDHEVIDSTLTDKNGNYSIVFDFIPGQRYGFLFISEYYGKPYFVDFEENNGPILEGEENIQNIDDWLPTSLKLNLRVRNNNNPNLGISGDTWPHGGYFFGGASIKEREIDTTVYLLAKPNAEMHLVFYYSTGNRNADAYKKNDFLTTTLQDTLELAYDLDCSTFESSGY